MKRFVNVAVYLLALIVSATSIAQASPRQAQTFPVTTDADLFEQVKDGVLRPSIFLQPNERALEHLPHIVQDIRPGAYITVGTERGFMTAAMLPQITRVLFIDMSPDVVLYNRINIELLKAATSYEEYVWLRTRTNAVELAARLYRETKIDRSEEAEWFLNALRTRNGVGDALIQTRVVMPTDPPVGQSNDPIPPLSGEVNYLKNRAMTERLMMLAKSGRLAAHLLNIDSYYRTAAFRNEIIGTDHVALVDLSNAWWSNYAGLDNAKAFISTLTAHSPHALALLTSRLEEKYDWFYMTFPATIADEPKAWAKTREKLKNIYAERLTDTDRLPLTYLKKRSPFQISTNAFRTCEALFFAPAPRSAPSARAPR